MNPILLFRSSACRLKSNRSLAIPAWFFGLVLGVATLGLSSCRTAQGFGQDVEHVGDKIEDAATR